MLSQVGLVSLKHLLLCLVAWQHQGHQDLGACHKDQDRQQVHNPHHHRHYTFECDSKWAVAAIMYTLRHMHTAYMSTTPAYYGSLWMRSYHSKLLLLLLCVHGRRGNAIYTVCM